MIILDLTDEFVSVTGMARLLGVSAQQADNLIKKHPDRFHTVRTPIGQVINKASVEAEVQRRSKRASA